MDRRGFITSVACLIAAPAIVRASSLMPVKSEKVWRMKDIGPLQTIPHDAYPWCSSIVAAQEDDSLARFLFETVKLDDHFPKKWHRGVDLERFLGIDDYMHGSYEKWIKREKMKG